MARATEALASAANSQVQGSQGLINLVHVKFDVFLCHERTDAKDFARSLYNMLVLRGLSTFLDVEDRSVLQYMGA